jgi:2'-5' RNA ligase
MTAMLCRRPACGADDPHAVPMTVAVDEIRDAKVRLFFALLPDAAVRERIAAAAAAIAPYLGPPPLGSQPESRWVPRSNYHVTIAFVGQVSVSQVQLLRQIGGAQRGGRFTLRFDAYEYWPTPKVLVAAACTLPPCLQQLSGRLRDALAAHDCPYDAKPLRPHVTLARKALQAPVLSAMASFDWHVNDFCLMRSDGSGVQPVYTVVDTWALLDN